MGFELTPEQITETLKNYQKILERAQQVADALGNDHWDPDEDTITWPDHLEPERLDDVTFTISWEEYHYGDYEAQYAYIPLNLLWNEEGDELIKHRDQIRERELEEARQRMIKSAQNKLAAAENRARTAQKLADREVETARKRLNDILGEDK